MNASTRLFIIAIIVLDLFAVIVFAGRYILTGSIMAEAEAPKIVVAAALEKSAEGSATAAAPAEAPFDYAAYVADAAKGAQVAGKCKACHTLDNGGPNRVGPNLWGVMAGHKPGSYAGFAYSGAMTDHGTKIGAWDDTHMFEFLGNPKEVVAGTKMQFNGIKNPKERADLIAYLKTLK